MHTLISEHPVLAQLWSYWCGKRRRGAATRRADVDLAAAPRLLPHVQIVERDAAGAFRYRSTGNILVDALGAGRDGRPLREVLPPERLEAASRHYAMAWNTGRPLCARNKDMASDAVERLVTRVVLPLVDEEGRVVAILTAQAFECRMRWKLETQVEQIGFLDAPAMADAEACRNAA